jgi:ribosomal protein S18 acetylase RimI-like enzyme
MNADTDAGAATIGRWLQNNQQPTHLGDLRLRKVDSQGKSFLLQLFRSCRPHLEQIPMPAEFIDVLVQQQYDLQRSDYARRFPGYLDFLILQQQESIGNLKLYEDDGHLHVLDIALLPEHRSKGHGRTLLRWLQAMASEHDKQVQLSVDRQNWRARKLYDTLGFELVGTSGSHDFMAWEAGQKLATPENAEWSGVR